jgi:hypothetical protein
MLIASVAFADNQPEKSHMVFDPVGMDDEPIE